MQRLRARGRRCLAHSGGFGSPSGSTTGACRSSRLDAALLNAGKSRRIFARKNGPGDRNRCGGSVERRFRGLWRPTFRTSRCGSLYPVRLSALRLPHCSGGPLRRPLTRVTAGTACAWAMSTTINTELAQHGLSLRETHHVRRKAAMISLRVFIQQTAPTSIARGSALRRRCKLL